VVTAPVGARKSGPRHDLALTVLGRADAVRLGDRAKPPVDASQRGRGCCHSYPGGFTELHPSSMPKTIVPTDAWDDFATRLRKPVDLSVVLMVRGLVATVLLIVLPEKTVPLALVAKRGGFENGSPGGGDLGQLPRARDDGFINTFNVGSLGQ